MSSFMSTEFRFFVPPIIEFGCGKRKTVTNYAKKTGITHALIVVDPYLLHSDYLREMIDELNNAEIKVSYWADVVPNPTDVSVDDAIRVYHENGCDGIIGFGGGSAMDTAKGVAVLACSNAKSIREHCPPGWKKTEDMAPLILVTTTAGTGAEVNPWAMINNTETGIKGVGFNASDLIAAQKVAIVDPELTASMPAKLTAITGMDAFCQVIECYLTRTPNPVSDAIAIHAIKIASDALPRAVLNGSDIEAREGMSLVSMMSTISFPNAGLSYPHQMSTMIYDEWGTAHGIAVAIVTRAALELLLETKMDRLCEISKAFGIADNGKSQLEYALLAIEEISRFMEKIGIPTFKEATGADREQIDNLIQKVSISGEVDQKTLEDYRKILSRSLEF